MMMFIRIFSIVALTGLSPGTKINAMPTEDSSIQQELTPPTIHGVHGSSMVTDAVELESGRRTSCMEKLISNLIKQGTKQIKKKEKNRIKKCPKVPKEDRVRCRKKAKNWAKKQIANFEPSYATVRDRCGGVCFDSEELQEAVILYTSDTEDDRQMAANLHGKIGDWPTCLTTSMAYLFVFENRDDDWYIDDGIGYYRDTADVLAFNGDSDNPGVRDFNENISSWDTSSVVDLYKTFIYTNLFNSDISSWDTSSVEVMSYAFADTDSFNINLSAWDISSVRETSYMFAYTRNFNQCLEWSLPFSIQYRKRMFYISSGRISKNC